ncbi:MAG: hypothetical protein ACOC44_00370 [Promethearchaeia archaeon]
MEQKGTGTSDSPYEKKENKEFQKKQFNFLLTLVEELFSKKNSKQEYHNVSNLILACLHSFNNIAVDEYHFKQLNEFSEGRDKFRGILTKEFENVSDEFKKFQIIGKKFQATLQNFLNRYDGVENIIFPPKK